MTNGAAINEKIHSSNRPDVKSNGDEKLQKSQFITTSDVINQLNRQLSDLSTDGTGFLGEGEKPRFELQKRLPDGSAMPATKDEIAAADFKTKLEQSAKFVSQLECPEDRQYWAEQQRLTGNAFFQQGDYKAAMDIYLTCLVVKEDTPDFVRDTFLPVLNNLAQCTLQLGMHMKTILFCEMALEEVSKSRQSSVESKDSQEEKSLDEETHESKLVSMQRDLKDAIALCKILFKQAKALRLTGHYKRARESLDNSLDCLIGEENEDGFNTQTLLAPYKASIKKEYRYLDVAEKEARKNQARQKRAMKTVLSSMSSTQDGYIIGEGFSSSHSLYEQPPEPRRFSRLRARKAGSSSPISKQNTYPNAFDPDQLSYSQYYWSMVARVAKSLLVMLGETNDIDGHGVSNSNS